MRGLGGLRRRTFQSVLLALLMLLSTTVNILGSNGFDQREEESIEMHLRGSEHHLFSGPKASTDWLQSFGPRTTTNGPDDINSVRMSGVLIDDVGDIYVTGSFMGDVTIGGTNLDSDVRRHAFIGKVTSSGVWEWIATTTDGLSQNGNAEFEGVVSDGNGTLYAYGWMNGQIDLNTSQLIMTAPGSFQNSGPNRGGLIVKMSSTGVFDWAVTIDGSDGHDAVQDAALRSDGHLYVVGQYYEEAFFNETHINTGGGYNGFFGLLNTTDLGFDFVRAVGGTSHSYADDVAAIVVDAQDNAIITGYYSDNAGNAFGNGHISFAARPTAGFVANLSSENQFNWVSTLVSGTSSSPSTITDIEMNGDAFVVIGSMGGVVEYDSVISHTSNGTSQHAFIGELNAMGDWLYSVRSDSANSRVAADFSWQVPLGLSVDSTGVAVVTGQFSQPDDPFVSNASFGNYAIIDGGSGGFLAGFDLSAQTWKWAVSFGSMGGEDRGVDVEHMADGRMLTVGNICLTEWCTAVIDGTAVMMDAYEGGGSILWATYPDTDLDGTPDKDDNCPTIWNEDQSDIDGDLDGDSCDDDIDDDGMNNYDDECDGPTVLWNSSVWALDRDGDGCHDATEDDDDDADGVLDASDLCNDATKQHNWTSTNLSDWDSDGCRDGVEDDDDDADGVLDDDDRCATNPSWNNWSSNASNDHDGDGCHDEGEDSDDDDDGSLDDDDSCPKMKVGWIRNATTDHDGDGCHDTDEDLDDDDDGVVDVIDLCPRNATAWTSLDITDNDGDGCRDADEDDDDDNDGLLDAFDSCPEGEHGWTSDSNSDRDGDGCKDEGSSNDGHGEDTDDDGDLKHDGADDCPQGLTGWVSTGATDNDGDGCKDDGEDPDDDNDGFREDNGEDLCPGTPMDDFVDGFGCSTSQGDDDGDGIANMNDACAQENATGWDENGDGCIDDIDDDGVKDSFDDCIAEPDGFSVGDDGCTQIQRDDDGDGIAGDTHPHGEDQCAGTWPNETTVSFGCSERQLEGLRDDDEDGLMNDDDLCPDTPEADLESAGGEGVDHDGCSYTQRDADGDGVSNGKDVCPGTPDLHEVDANGCSASQLGVGESGFSSGAMLAVFGGVGVVLLAGAAAALILLKGKRSAKPSRQSRRPASPAGPTAAPIGPTGGPKMVGAEIDEPSEQGELVESSETDASSAESTSTNDGVTLDEHGTSWYTDDQGSWWYRTPEMADWARFEQ